MIIYSIVGPLFLKAFPQLLTAALIATPVLFGVLGVIISPHLYRSIAKFTDYCVSKLSRMPAADIAGAIFGLVVGLIIASLLGTAVGRISVIGGYLSVILSIFFGYVGLMMGYKRREEVVGMIKGWRGDRQEKGEKTEKVERGEKTEKRTWFGTRTPQKILDTSVVIDGRIWDIYRTGFVEGDLVIPGFVLEELRHIADSGDTLKRNRGRRGLDILNKLREDFGDNVKINEKNYPDIVEVDSKLLKMAQELHGVVVTNDYNLNKVAQFQGVKVLNINELSNAVKPMVLPGEELPVQMIKEGKELNQGVAYLDDGTMIVVENGRKYLNKTIVVVVTSVLQTAAGRMIFARPKLSKHGDVEETEFAG